VQISSGAIVIVVGLLLLAAGLYGKGGVFVNAWQQLTAPAPAKNPNAGNAAPVNSSATGITISPAPVVVT
jgi:hypothetical protein